jgi:glycosyltransferase involved in cell wall biosynthesis
MFNRYFPRKKLQMLYSPLNNLLNIPPDDFVDWFPFLCRVSKGVIAKNKIDIIFSTAPPFTVHLVALALKRKFKIKWVADFRDEWVDNPFREYYCQWKNKLDKLYERMVIKNADSVIVATERYKEFLKEKYPSESKKIVSISNGYDADDFKCIGNIDRAVNNSALSIFYAGKFYGLRKANMFLDAVNNLLVKDLIPKHKIKIDFAGVYDWALDDYLDGKPIKNVLNCLGFLSHSEIISRYQTSSLLLLVVNPESKLSIPGKTYEYLAARKPILALIPRDSASADLLAQQDSCVIVNPLDNNTIEQAVLDLYKKWASGQLESVVQRKSIQQYEANALCKKLVDIIN